MREKGAAYVLNIVRHAGASAGLKDSETGNLFHDVDYVLDSCHHGVDVVLVLQVGCGGDLHVEACVDGGAATGCGAEPEVLGECHRVYLGEGTISIS